MSLINDALRKARREAAEQQEAERRGRAVGGFGTADYRPPRAHLPERSRLGLGIALGLVLAAALLAGAGAAFFFLRPPAETQEAAVQVPVEVAESAAPAPTAASREPEEPSRNDPPTERREDPETLAEASASQPEPEPPIPNPNPAPASESPARNEPAPSSEAPARTVVDAPRHPEPTPAPTPETPPSAAEEPEAADADLPKLIEPPEAVGRVGETNVFVLEADVGDLTVTLDFIVWNPSKPFAQINGEQVEVGQLVAGLLVERIERDRVTLKATDGRIVLRVR